MDLQIGLLYVFTNALAFLCNLTITTTTIGNKGFAILWAVDHEQGMSSTPWVEGHEQWADDLLF